MFRKPRDQAIPTPSVGRPPSPPNTPSPKSAPIPVSNPMAGAKTPKAKGAQNKISSFFGKVTVAQAQAQRQAKKPNESILKFFQKVDTPVHFERDLFVGGAVEPINAEVEEDFSTLDDQENRYNETGAAIKRRRIDDVEADEVKEIESRGPEQHSGLATPVKTPETLSEEHRLSINGDPFAEDSGSEDECPVEDIPEVRTEVDRTMSSKSETSLEVALSSHEVEVKTEDPADDVLITEQPASIEKAIPTTDDVKSQLASTITPQPPPLLRKDTSWITNDDLDEFGEFDADEFYENGEEYVERRYMEEQAELEKESEQDKNSRIKNEMPVDEQQAQHSNAACPICSSSLEGLSEQDVSVHVNGCLDDKPVPLPVKTESEEKSILTIAKRFQRSAIPRPGQANPHSSAPATSNGSAFSKLMSSHAEDEAWAIAAANEMAARGKPAFKRTCPFYKILPGFFTCVDAFRYGAVEGCNAYFLSHFHSDHYIGLTSTWCHGPIYCSKVTGNLVRQQLRVDPKWVVDLEWEKKTEVPKTEGLFVTMISANHCPGSSIFLFEKVMTRGSNNSKLQRVLHCGDFRACPAHVQHPLLRPNVMDSVTGHLRQQKLDVCYLDTTYLTPKYAFPSQESVIQACADMCVSLSKDQVDKLDTWEKTKKARAGSGMVKFVQKDVEEQVEDIEPKKRGRLLVVCGTYSIGKERICVGIARALNSKIFAPAGKRKICMALEDPELASLLTDDPYDAQIHMQMLMEIRPETLADYLTEYKPHFSRIVGFRPTGWSYRPPNSRFVESPLVQTVLNSDNWKSSFTMAELIPQRGSTRESNCFGVPYSEHSSFRELTMFCCALRIDKIIPTVNIGSAKSRDNMKGWIEKWNSDKKKNGLYKVADDATSW